MAIELQDSVTAVGRVVSWKHPSYGGFVRMARVKMVTFSSTSTTCVIGSVSASAPACDSASKTRIVDRGP